MFVSDCFLKKYIIFKMVRKNWQLFAPKKRTKLRIIFNICKFLGRYLHVRVRMCSLFVKFARGETLSSQIYLFADETD